MKKRSLVAAASIGFMFLLVLSIKAEAAEIKVLSAFGMQSVLEDLGPKFERATGHKLALTFATGGAIVKRVQGEPDDIVLGPNVVVSEIQRVPDHACWLRIKTIRADIDRFRVINQSDFRLLRRRLAIVRFLLNHLVNDGGLLPCRIRQIPIHDRRGVDPRRPITILFGRPIVSLRKQ